MSGLTLPAGVARGRHRKPTPNHAECYRSVIMCVIVYSFELQTK